MKNSKKNLEYGLQRLANSPLKVNRVTYCKECGSTLPCTCSVPEEKESNVIKSY